MVNPKVIWARKQLASELKGVKSSTERKQIFKDVWKQAAKKFPKE